MIVLCVFGIYLLMGLLMYIYIFGKDRFDPTLFLVTFFGWAYLVFVIFTEKRNDASSTKDKYNEMV